MMVQLIFRHPEGRSVELCVWCKSSFERGRGSGEGTQVETEWDEISYHADETDNSRKR